jgi:hypothetical protein
MPPSSYTFSAVVRSVAREAREIGLAVPVFRSPPHLEGEDRTIHRRHGDLVVAVRLRDRALCDVVADVIEGVIVANRLADPDDVSVRLRLLHAVESEVYRAA